MKQLDQLFLNYTVEDMLSDDEIDELFTQLLHVEPPAALVDTILATAASLPLLISSFRLLPSYF